MSILFISYAAALVAAWSSCYKICFTSSGSSSSSSSSSNDNFWRLSAVCSLETSPPPSSYKLDYVFWHGIWHFLDRPKDFLDGHNWICAAAYDLAFSILHIQQRFLLLTCAWLPAGRWAGPEMGWLAWGQGRRQVGRERGGRAVDRLACMGVRV